MAVVYILYKVIGLGDLIFKISNRNHLENLYDNALILDILIKM